MKPNPLNRLEIYGQSIWLDYIRRSLLSGGKLRRLIDKDGLHGINSNLLLFKKALLTGSEYQKELRKLIHTGEEAPAIFEHLIHHDVQAAADAFRPLYNRTNGAAGFANIDINPHLANNKAKTIKEARRVWRVLNRPNVMIKIPATDAGLSAIRQLISDGINVHATLIFSPVRYRQVAEAYLTGLESRIEQEKPLHGIASVAAFFLNSIDTAIDPLLTKAFARSGGQAILAKKSRGQVSIASAKSTHQVYKEIFDSDRFKKLTDQGARPQHLLWSGTGTKNPEYSDVKYVEELIGPDTLSSLPIDTLNAYRDHGEPEMRLETETSEAARILKRLPVFDIDLDEICQQLENEELTQLREAYDTLMESLAARQKT